MPGEVFFIWLFAVGVQCLASFKRRASLAGFGVKQHPNRDEFRWGEFGKRNNGAVANHAGKNGAVSGRISA